MDRILFGFSSHPLVWVGIDLKFPCFVCIWACVMFACLGDRTGWSLGKWAYFAPFSFLFPLLADW